MGSQNTVVLSQPLIFKQRSHGGQATIMQMFLSLIMHLKTMRVSSMFMDTLGRGKLIMVY